MPKKINGEKPKIQCQGTSCGHRLLVRNAYNFYKSNNPIHNNEMCGGYAPICKGCLKELCMGSDNQININGLMYVLKFLNKPFIKDVYLKLLNSEGGFDLGTYLKDISFNAYVGLQFSDSDDSNSIKNNTVAKNEIKDITSDIIIKWGQGYSKEDYKILEGMYDKWTEKYKSDTLAEQKTFKFLCLKEFEIMKFRSEGKPVDKLEDTYIKFMNAANVTPRDSIASDPDNMNSLGVWIQEIERTRPAEYFKNKKIYEDFDQLTKYLQRFIFRPLKNLLTGSRDFDSEFNVENLSHQEEIGSYDEKKKE